MAMHLIASNDKLSDQTTLVLQGVSTAAYLSVSDESIVAKAAKIGGAASFTFDGTDQCAALMFEGKYMTADENGISFVRKRCATALFTCDIPGICGESGTISFRSLMNASKYLMLTEDNKLCCKETPVETKAEKKAASFKLWIQPKLVTTPTRSLLSLSPTSSSSSKKAPASSSTPTPKPWLTAKPSLATKVQAASSTTKCTIQWDAAPSTSVSPTKKSTSETPKASSIELSTHTVQSLPSAVQNILHGIAVKPAVPKPVENTTTTITTPTKATESLKSSSSLPPRSPTATLSTRTAAATAAAASPQQQQQQISGPVVYVKLSKTPTPTKSRTPRSGSRSNLVAEMVGAATVSGRKRLVDEFEEEENMTSSAAKKPRSKASPLPARMERDNMSVDDEEDDDDDDVEDIVCENCGNDRDENKLVLCDGCNKGWHIYCMQPVLKKIPRGKWFCDTCFQQGTQSKKKKSGNTNSSNSDNNKKRKKRIAEVEDTGPGKSVSYMNYDFGGTVAYGLDDEDDHNVPNVSDHDDDNESIEDADDNRAETDGICGDDYFAAHYGTVKKSDTTWADVETAPEQEVTKAMGSLPDPISSESSNALYCKYEANFPRWEAQLQSGWSLLFHGVGSKKKLLEHFCTCRLHDGIVIVVNAYMSTFSPRTLLKSVAETIVGRVSMSMSAPIHEWCSLIERSLQERAELSGANNKEKSESSTRRKPLSTSSSRAYILIHNIDAPSCRQKDAQRILSSLAAVDRVHLIASVDQLNAPLLWDPICLRQFNFLSHMMHTFERYTTELPHTVNIATSIAPEKISGASVVLRSLNSTARRVFGILGNFQLENPEARGIALSALQLRLKQEFLDTGLKNHMAELRDHKLLKERNSGGSQLLYIPLSNDALRKLINEIQ